MTLHIAHLTPPDLPAAGDLLDTAFGRRGMVRSLRLAYNLQPAGWFGAHYGDELAGVVGGHDYGLCASIGMMAVAPAHRGQGLARTLMTHLLAYLDGRGCPLSFLDASAAGQPVYPKLGFSADGETWRLVKQDSAPRPVTPGPTFTGQVRQMTDDDLPAVIAFDTPRFGAARPAVLHAFYGTCPDRAFIATDANNQVNGYLIAEQAHIGPWTAATPAAAANLLQVALTLPYQAPPLLTLPAANTDALALLARHGFAHTETLLHMRRGGGADPRDCSQIYAQASLTLG
jgi:GNAT superfamily N-acetyltransferase